MIRFDHLQLDPCRPVYLQLAEHVKRQILLGTAQDGDELPSRREIAAEADVNPNTVQKAYRQMEQEGYVVTDGNRPSTIHLTPELRAGIESELCEEMVRRFIGEAKKNHMDYRRTIETITRLWED